MTVTPVRVHVMHHYLVNQCPLSASPTLTRPEKPEKAVPRDGTRTRHRHTVAHARPRLPGPASRLMALRPPRPRFRNALSRVRSGLRSVYRIDRARLLSISTQDDCSRSVAPRARDSRLSQVLSLRSRQARVRLLTIMTAPSRVRSHVRGAGRKNIRQSQSQMLAKHAQGSQVCASGVW